MFSSRNHTFRNCKVPSVRHQTIHIILSYIDVYIVNSLLNGKVYVALISYNMSRNIDSYFCLACKEWVADVFFLLDQSSSILSVTNFKKELQFVVEVIDSLDIDQQKTQVAVLKFGSNAYIEFNLNEFHTRKELANRIIKIQWKGGNIYLEKVLRKVRMQGLTPNSNIFKC